MRALLLLGCTLLTSCTSLSSRGADAGDILSGGLIVGMGARAQVLPVATTVGLLANGFVYQRRFVDGFGPCGPISFDGGAGFFGNSVRGGRPAPYEVNYIFVGPVEYLEAEDQKAAAESGPRIHPYYTDIEVAAALLLGVRAGFNPGELVDFLLGWFGVDIYGDDEVVEAEEEPTTSSRE